MALGARIGFEEFEISIEFWHSESVRFESSVSDCFEIDWLVPGRIWTSSESLSTIVITSTFAYKYKLYTKREKS